MIVAQALAGIVSGAINDGGYTYGEWGLNDGVCKHGGSAVTSSSGCQTLATLISGVTVSPVNDGTKPKGCYSNYNSNGFYFNSHATGAAHGGLAFEAALIPILSHPRRGIWGPEKRFPY